MSTSNGIGTMLTAVALLAVSSQALASRAIDKPRNDGRPTTTVSAADLNLANPGDVEALYRRVQSAANGVCRVEMRGEMASTRKALSGWRDRCVQSAVDDAIRNVGDQRLTAVHRDISERIASL
jgi:UrcA family protein